MNLERAKQPLIFRVLRNIGYNIIFTLLLTLVIIAHLYQLSNIPAGLYRDESFIGYHIALIAQTGIDEHGVYFPLYSKVPGESINPIYVYTAALIFKFFGMSEFNLRLTSFIFYITALIFTLLLVSKIFKKSKIVQIYTLLSFGFLPHFFTLSRISFDVISQLTLVSAAVLFIWMIFHEEEGSRLELDYLKISVCGLILGTSVYTYPTARLLSFLMLVSLWAVYYKRDNIKKLVTITLLFFIALIPYFIFIVNNPGAITSRFRNISYLYSSISVIKKIAIFVYNVVAYWSPGFLIRYGDLNLRHSTGYGGVIFSITLFLFLLGLVNILFNKRLNKFNIFLLINLLLSPLAAILTSEGTPHALRSLLLGYYILLISCYGLGFILTVGDYYHRKILIACTLILLIFEVIGYQLNYFIFYPSISVETMDSFDFKESLQIAIDQNPKEIIFVNNPPNTDKHLKFYSYLVENSKGIPIRMSEQPIPTLGSCVLYHRRNEEELNQFPYTFIEHENSRHLNLIERLFGVAPWYNMETVSIIKVRCYENSK